MKKLFLASALTSLTFSVAQAADAVVYEPVPETPIAASFDWTGAYIGAAVGHAWGDSSHAISEFNGIGSVDPDGFFGGLYVGYNYQLHNNLVIGFDADINASGIDGSAPYKENGIQFNDHINTSDVKYSAAIRARLGYASDRWMPYLAGGLSFARYNITHGEPGDHVDFDLDKTMTGWNIGGGVEYAATDNIIIRAEYRYSDFGDWDFDEWDGPSNVDLKTHDIRLGIAYKF